MTMTTMRQALVDAMHLPADSEALAQLHGSGLAIADEDTMSRAIHDVYCGIMADHEHPNEKDRDQARQLLDALNRTTAA
jgi:hypothetical protein